MATQTTTLGLTLYIDDDEVDVSGLSRNYQLIDDESGHLRAEVARKANRPTASTAGHLATLDKDGNLVDSGKALGDLAAGGHNHDDRYYTKAESNNLLGGKSDTNHNHNAAYAVKATETTASNALNTANAALARSGGTMTGALVAGGAQADNQAQVRNMIVYPAGTVLASIPIPAAGTIVAVKK